MESTTTALRNRAVERPKLLSDGRSRGNKRQLSQNELFRCLKRRSRSGRSTPIPPIKILPFLRKTKKRQAALGRSLARRMRTKSLRFGNTLWRETLINHLVNAGYSNRIVEMLTGKTGHTPLNQYTSDDLASMQKAIDEHAAYLNLLHPSAALMIRRTVGRSSPLSCGNDAVAMTPLAHLQHAQTVWIRHTGDHRASS